MSGSTPSRKQTHISLSKIDKLKCRVETCQALVVSQNYGRHLERFHPAENSKDRRAYGQGKFSFGMVKAVAEDGDESNEDEQDYDGRKEDINENVLPTNDGGNTAIEDIAGRKRARTEDDYFTAGAEGPEDIHEIEKKVDKIIEELELVAPNRQEKQVDTIKHKLDYILKNLKVSKTVDELEKMVREVKKMTVSNLKVEASSGEKEKEDIFRVLVACKSVAEIESRVPEFQFQEEKAKLVCRVCNAEFKYDVSLELGRKQSENLINLKNNLKTHLKKSATHSTALSKTEAKDKINEKEESRSVKCGMNLVRTSYHILNNGRPTSDFTELLSMQHSNGCDIGDINHSTNFVTKIASSFSTVITGRIKKHLSTRLPQTCCFPPCKVVEDSATYRHDTRLFIGLTTVFPGSKPLLQSVFCGAPKGVKGDAATIAESMFSTVSPYICPEQYLGTSEDGANFLAHVGEHLDQLMGVEGHHDWDGVHAAATVDTGLRNPKKEWAKKFSWLNETTDIISKAFRFINWGMEWARFFKVKCANFLL